MIARDTKWRVSAVPADKTNDKDPDTFFLPDLCGRQSLLILVLVAELLALLAVLVRFGLRHFDWTDFSLASLFTLWSALGSAALLCRARPWLQRQSLPMAATVSYGLILAVVALISVLGQWLTRGLLGGAVDWRIDTVAVFDNLLICAVIAGIALRYLYVAQQLRLRQRGELAARIQALQSRIQPHFLFNSLNSIASLVATDPRTAEGAVEDLAALFRASLQRASAETSWREERELCERYLRIEALRLGERLRVEWRAAGLPDDARLPLLSLQPLLENAIVHGIQELPDGGVIGIDGEVGREQVNIAVTNPIPADRSLREEGNRMAIDNIHHRLQAMYGEAAGLQASVDAQGRFCARLRFPLRREPA